MKYLGNFAIIMIGLCIIIFFGGGLTILSCLILNYSDGLVLGIAGKLMFASIFVFGFFICVADECKVL